MSHDNHADTLLQSLHDLYQRHLLTDVVLVVGGREFSVHITVLVSYSQYFKNMLGTTLFYNDRHYLKSWYLHLYNNLEVMIWITS